MTRTQIALRRQVTDVAVLMPVADAIAFLRNPSKLQEDVADMLRGGGVDPSSGELMPSALFETGLLPRELGPAPATKSGRKKYERKPGPMTNCPECGKPYKTRGLALHMKGKHGISVPLTGAEEPAEDPRLDAGMAALDGEA